MSLISNISNTYRRIHIYPKILVAIGLLIVIAVSLWMIVDTLSLPESRREGHLANLPSAIILSGGIILFPFLLSAVITAFEKNKRSVFIPVLSILIAAVLYKIYFIFLVYNPAPREIGGCVLYLNISPLYETVGVLLFWGIYRLIASLVTSNK
jgi:hypothetical protein